MNVLEIITGGGGALIVLLSLVQISPIKVNPWSAIARSIGRAMNIEIKEDLEKTRADIQKQIDETKLGISEQMEETKADTARYRILRFADEIRHNIPHSEEHYNQIIEEIDDYDRYCKEHKEYMNSKATTAIASIKSAWSRHIENNDFLV